jgi:hypothetical protein
MQLSSGEARGIKPKGSTVSNDASVLGEDDHAI